MKHYSTSYERRWNIALTGHFLACYQTLSQAHSIQIVSPVAEPMLDFMNALLQGFKAYMAWPQEDYIDVKQICK